MLPEMILLLNNSRVRDYYHKLPDESSDVHYSPTWKGPRMREVCFEFKEEEWWNCGLNIYFSFNAKV